MSNQAAYLHRVRDDIRWHLTTRTEGEHLEEGVAVAKFLPDPRYHAEERMTCGGMEFDIYKDGVKLDDLSTFAEAMAEIERLSAKEQK